MVTPSPRLPEMTATDEGHRRPQRRQRRWMICGQHFVTVCIDQSTLALRMRSPEHEDDRPVTLGDVPNHLISQDLPAATGMAGRLALFDRQAGIEQKDAVRRPFHEAAAGIRE